MNLRDKLRAVGGDSGRRETPAEPPSLDCRHFAVYRPEEEFPGARELTADTLRLMSDREIPEALDPRKILYLDTETTGLGGSGTVAFLVGMGYLSDDGFEVHQFLMRDYPEEPYLLKHVAAGLGKFDVLCTFNGATFDVPLLESRFLMNRMDRSCLDLPMCIAYLHVILADVLHSLTYRPVYNYSERGLGYRIISYISEHACDEITLESASRALGVSVSHLSHFFGERMHTSFRGFINAIRVERARLLMRDPNLTLMEICDSCGYTNMRTFRRAFQAEAGCLPSEYMRDTRVRAIG